MGDESRIDRHYGLGGLWERIETGLRLTGRTAGTVKVEDLAPVDAFHTRGRAATLEMAELAGLGTADRVLDVGCGLGGTPRLLASLYGCPVVGVDVTAEYVAVGNRLTDLVGLSPLVRLEQASALDLPYADGSFDVVWTEHVQMNVADKAGFYAEIARVLQPGGRLLFHDVFRGPGEEPVYPAPWAEDASLSFLATQDEVRAILVDVGLTAETWLDRTPESAAWFAKAVARIAAKGPPPLGIHLLMGATATDKIRNYSRNLLEHRVTVGLGVARRI
jgi:ubiquinone/menaquinone biosynthesis C-methylase UbiE